MYIGQSVHRIIKGIIQPLTIFVSVVFFLDFRLMEAFASGALIFVDRMYVPRFFPLVEGKHVVYYDNDNKTDLFAKLDMYRTNRRLAHTVAWEGYIHTMRHHRAVCLIDYVLRTVHSVQLQLRKSTIGGSLHHGNRSAVTTSSNLDLPGLEEALKHAHNMKKYPYTGHALRRLAFTAATELKQQEKGNGDKRKRGQRENRQ